MSASPRPAPSPATLRLTEQERPSGLSRLAAPGLRSIPARALARWHLLSLDAPTVAALWVVFIARCAGVELPWTEPAAMFLAVWILYAADRLLDARSLLNMSGEADLEARHRFHQRHRAAFRGGLLVALVALAVLLRHEDAVVLRLDVILGGSLLSWLFTIHKRAAQMHPSRRLPKELAVGLFFSAATFIPIAARTPPSLGLLLDALLLAALCSLNCLYIFRWEHPSSRALHAHGSTRWAIERLPKVTLATAGVAVSAAAFHLTAGSSLQDPRTLLSLPALACAESSLLLLILHGCQGRFSAVTLRAAADLCLLAPALMMPVLLLQHSH